MCCAERKEEIAKLLDDWFAALAKGGQPVKTNTGDPIYKADDIMLLYDEYAILLPTLMNGPNNTTIAIRNYFEQVFLPQEPKGFLINQNIRLYGELAINSGHYLFSLKDDKNNNNNNINNNVRKLKSSRFTFVYKKFPDESNPDKSKWLIVEHHSSKFPEEHSIEELKWLGTEKFV